MSFRQTALFACLFAVGCTDEAAKTGSQCVQSDLIAQCPPGSNAILGAQAQQSCGGKLEGDLLEQSGSVSAQCNGSGECRVLCQFAVPCPCGVARIDRQALECADCQVNCGNGRCEGLERASCEGQPVGCAVCLEDCSGANCGDGDCTQPESPQSCPQDCATECNPGDPPRCVANMLQLCSANGRITQTDCGSASVCGPTGCVVAGVCGNQVCETSESPGTCPADCATICTPSSVRCDGNLQVRCAADGRSESTTDCATSNQVCSNGQCVAGNVCGNGACEAGENPGTCPSDCQIVCGNQRCETGEQVSCPQDCAVCGNHTCEANEIDTCPQDCGICRPGARECVGSILNVCNANGTALLEPFDCASQGQTCGRGNCVPNNVCGNGVCEGDEATTCGLDCAERCGNGSCGGSENFATCAVDCEPVCGDTVCDASESVASCPTDCQVTCGNNNCDTFERNANGVYCARDCGFCGDGVCQDGFETSSDRPVGGLAPCPADCVVLACTQPTDCSDRLTCTDDSCGPGGACVYTANDTRCPAGKCLGRLSTATDGSGCCADADGDQFASSACGGTDCNDHDAAYRPGAVEACGGPDLNCNGSNRPTLRPVIQLSSDLSGKDSFVVEAGGGVYGAAWVERPFGSPQLVAAIIQPNGAMSVPVLLDDQPDTVPWTDWNLLAMTYSSGRNAFAITWRSSQGKGSINWLGTNGQKLRTSPLLITADLGGAHAFDFPRLNIAYNNGVHLISYAIGSSYFVVTDNEIVTPGYSDTWRSCGSVPVGNGFMLLRCQGADGGGRVVARVRSVDSAGQFVVENFLPDGQPDQAPALMWDGAALVLVFSWGGGIRVERVTPAAAIVTDQTFQTPANLVVSAAFMRDAVNPANSKVGILHSDSSAMWFTVRGIDGSRVLDSGQIAAAPQDSQPRGKLFYDGSNFTAIFTSLVSGVKQISMTTIGCQ